MMDLRKLVASSHIGAGEIRAVYDKHFTPKSFPTSKVKSRPHFDSDQYPPIPPGYLEQEIRAGTLPTWTSAKDLLKRAADDSPLARILAAYIWKRGELPRVRHLRDGMKPTRSRASSVAEQRNDEADDAPLTDSASVMRQFGRHLREPVTQPIVDQHTYRAFLLLTRGGYLPSDTKNLRPQDVEEYCQWWNGITARMRREGRERLDALQALDRLLFSFGKAALLRPDLFRRDKKRGRNRIDG